MPALGLLVALLPCIGRCAESAQDHYRSDLVAMIDVVRDVRARAGSNAPGSDETLDRAALLFAQFSDAQVDALQTSLTASQFHVLVTEAQRGLRASAPAGAKNAIVAAPNVTPSFCTDYPAPVVYAALGTKLVTRHVIEAAEFTCHTSVLGFNTALGCEAPEIAAAAAEIASTLADFCGNQLSAASNTAMLETERSIGRHLNLQLDAPISTRASQVALDEAADAADSADTASAALQTQHAQDFVQLDAQLDDLVTDLAGLGQQLADIQSRTDELVFRVQATQVDIEDAQDRSADVQARATELNTVLNLARTQSSQLATNSATLASTIQASARQQRRDELGLALGDPIATAALFALPSSSGGRLEEAREVVIEAITALQSLGQGNTAAALVSLSTGDAHYNAGQYPEAWNWYATAYRQLDPNVAAIAGGTP
ncbi:hypothetical protein C7S18_18865 [Ahniella affigens]|uniref:Uncharacterized protein n=1 Tax=Ahniella affigens TaxID=2021234 RepID=A0A2P1PW81_9GAMM|nr:hypothetical protein C7S18_18865 [Ahniella affigens]